MCSKHFLMVFWSMREETLILHNDGNNIPSKKLYMSGRGGYYNIYEKLCCRWQLHSPKKPWWLPFLWQEYPHTQKCTCKPRVLVWKENLIQKSSNICRGVRLQISKSWKMQKFLYDCMVVMHMGGMYNMFKLFRKGVNYNILCSHTKVK